MCLCMTDFPHGSAGALYAIRSQVLNTCARSDIPAEGSVGHMICSRPGNPSRWKKWLFLNPGEECHHSFLILSQCIMHGPRTFQLLFKPFNNFFIKLYAQSLIVLNIIYSPYYEVHFIKSILIFLSLFTLYIFVSSAYIYKYNFHLLL